MRRVIYLAVILFGIAPATSAAEKECDSRDLPRVARKVLVQHLPNWRIVTVSDLSPDDQRLWSENHEGKCPGVIEGNFTTVHSFAVSLIRQEHATLLQILVLLEQSHNGYILRTLSGASRTAVPNILLKFPPGKYRDAEQTRSVQTKFDGVAYIKLEAEGTLYYKAKEGFKSLEISE